MEREKIVFLTKGKYDYVISGMYDEDTWAIPVYRYDNFLCKVCAQFFSKININIALFFLGKWARNIGDFDVIVCEGLKKRKWIFEILEKITDRHKCRIVMWHWNIISKYEINPDSVLSQKIEQWSFDEGDCARYGMQYNSQYFGTFSVPKERGKEWDVYFLGADKGRMKKLEIFSEKCQSQNINVNLYVTSDEKKKRFSQGNIQYKEPISYQDNIENDMKTNAILEIPQEGQEGLTLRTLEALYLKKKLITTNKNIQNFSFFNKNNILIYDENTTGETISNFLKIPYCETQQNEEARNYYSFVSWVRRFERIKSK